MKVDYSFQGSKLIVTVDGDNDGTPVLSLTLDLMELPSEVIALISAKK